MERVMRLQEVLETTGLRRATIYAMEAANRFPKRIKLGSASGWLASEVAGWLQARIAERDGANDAA